MNTHLSKAFILSLFILFQACNFSSQSDLDRDKTRNITDMVTQEDESFSILFSHNINGETHPCGCRQFPLGGLAQVAGLFHEIKSERAAIYIDTGNTFFPSITVPSHVADSLTFTAHNISKGLDKLELTFFVPGGQDFASGKHFLKNIIENKNYTLLGANLNDPDFFHSKPWTKLEIGKTKIYLVGLISPNHLPQNESNLVTETKPAFEKSLKEMEEDGLNTEDPHHRVVVLSSAGMTHDIDLAENFEQIDWIIGSHSQSFLQRPRNINQSKIVQVLSRNHYIGEVIFDLEAGREKDDYKIHEVNESKKDLIDPNPLSQFLSSYLEELSKIQIAEQEKMTSSFSSDDKLIPTAQSCLECHTPQAQKWMETPHSMAFLTLEQANEASNLSCVECHSVGLGDPHGFQRTQDIVIFEKQIEHDDVEEKKLQALRSDYWQAVRKNYDDVGSVRALRPDELRKHSQEWLNIDQQFNVAHNFSGVQCMNCHNQPLDHPFDFGTEARTEQQKSEMMKNNCLSCHDADQSPQWYHKDERGLATEVDEEVLKEMIEKVACPSLSYD